MNHILSQALSVVVVTVITGWLLVSIFAQHQRTRRFVTGIVTRDIFSLVPVWTFFAPNPGRTDLYLLYRDAGADGEMTSWKEIALGDERTLFSLWNPLRRIRKGVIDLAPELTRGVNYRAHEPVTKKKVLGFPYLLLLNYVSLQPTDFRATTRQFAVARTNGFGTEDQPEVLFLSAFHQLPNAQLMSGGDDE